MGNREGNTMTNWLRATVAIRYKDDAGNTQVVHVTRLSKWLTILGVMIIGASAIQTVVHAVKLMGWW